MAIHNNEVAVILENDIDFVTSKDNKPEDNLNEKDDEQNTIHIYKWRKRDVDPIDTSLNKPPFTSHKLFCVFPKTLLFINLKKSFKKLSPANEC